jgi:hypothetical protein
MTQLTEDDRKLLTKFLGECWHDPLWHDMRSAICTTWGLNGIFDLHRSFSPGDWQDLGDLKNKLVEKGMWREFRTFAQEAWCEERQKHYMFPLYSGGLAMSDDYLIDPGVFIPLVVEFLKEREKNGKTCD